MNEKDKYLQNKAEVYRIYGISLRNKNYNCHHIIFRSDVGILVPSDYDVNAVSNLIPLRKETHQRLHDRVELLGLQI